MLDRLFMPALTFTLLVAATAAFATEFAAGPATAVERQAATLECVVASAATHAVALLEPAAAALR